MTFDKETYWANRKEGKRGQGEPQGAVVRDITPDDARQFKHGLNLRRVNGQLLLVNRKTKRLRQVDRSGSKPNWKSRRKLSWADRIKLSRAVRWVRDSTE